MAVSTLPSTALSDSSRHFAGERQFPCLVPLHWAHFSAPPLLFPAFSSLLLPCLSSQSFYPLHYLEKSKIFEVSLLLLPAPSVFFSMFYCNLFPSVSRQQIKPGQGTSVVMMKWKTAQTLDNVNKTDTCYLWWFILILFFLIQVSVVP